MSTLPLTAVIPAGGAGTRLWPLSRAAAPKFLHDLSGSGRSMLQCTVDRLRPLVGDQVLVVTGALHVEAVREHLPHLPPESILVEPAPRNSMPAIGLAAAVLEKRDPHAILGSFAADHVIGDAEVFADRIHQAVQVARTGALVTLGITPTHPATGYGYIQTGSARGVPEAPDALDATVFVEKPDLETARKYVESGDYLWNAGMFVVAAGVLLELLEYTHPEMVRDLRLIAANPATIHDRWEALESISIDHAVAEPAARAGRVAVVRAPFAWDDVGDFASLLTLLSRDREGRGVQVLGDRRLVVEHESTGLVVAQSGRMIVTLGVDDVVVVDTPDALLVTTRGRCQDVKSVVDELQRTGKGELT